MYDLEIDKKTLKELKKIPKSDQEKIMKKMSALQTDPRPVGYEPLHGKLSNYYRIRFGNYRIVYEVFDKKLIILIVKVEGRGSVYKKK